MSGNFFIYLAEAVWIVSVVLFILFIIYDVNRGRLIRKRLREDYGEECCQRFSPAETYQTEKRRDYSEYREKKRRKKVKA